MYPFRLNYEELLQSEEGLKVLGQVFGIHGGKDEWDTISHIVVNEDGLKMPVPRDESQNDASGAIAFKFVMNPAKIEDLDELYDAFEVNKGSNVKYLVMVNTRDHQNPSQMSLQQKLYRKFFYENSGFLDSEVKFLEITNERVAARVGLTSNDVIMMV